MADRLNSEVANREPSEGSPDADPTLAEALVSLRGLMAPAIFAAALAIALWKVWLTVVVGAVTLCFVGVRSVVRNRRVRHRLDD